MDLAKASDNVSTKIIFAVLEKIGMDAKLLRTLQGMYAQVQRRGRFVGEAFRSTNVHFGDAPDCTDDGFAQSL